jgi:hypothetical protein
MGNIKSPDEIKGQTILYWKMQEMPQVGFMQRVQGNSICLFTHDEDRKFPFRGSTMLY